MPSARARRVQAAIAVFLAALGLVALAYAANAIQLGDNIGLRTTNVRRVVAVIGALLLGSAALAAVWPRWRATQAKLFFSACVVAVLLALAEVGARLAGHVPAPLHPRDSYWTADPELGYVCLPNCRFRFLSSKGWIEGSTDAAGYRPCLAAADVAGAPSVICLGDSTTFSTEVRDDETWPEAAGRELVARGRPTRMVNRGVAGYNGLQSLLTLQRSLATSGDVRGVAYLFCCNDPIENFASFMPAPLLQRAGEGFVVRPPEDALVTAVAGLRLKPDSALLTAFRTWRFRTDETAYRGAGLSLYRNHSGFCRRFVEDRDVRDGMRFVLARMKQECDRRGVLLFVLNPPSQLWPADESSRAELEALVGPFVSREQFAEDARRYAEATTILQRMTEDVGARWADLRGCLGGMGYREYLASPSDWHFSAEANERIGAAVAREVGRALK